ncbi:hypothetical protein ACFE04_030178 [Oxalis oulophora]
MNLVSRLRLKNGSTKTVPVVDPSGAVKSTDDPPAKTLNCDESRASKPKLKWKFISRAPYGVEAIAKVETAQDNIVPQTSHGRAVEDINLGNAKNLDNKVSSNAATCSLHKQSKTGSIQPDPKLVIHNRKGSNKKMRPSISLPVEKQCDNKVMKENKTCPDTGTGLGLGLDPMVGVSIMIVTLVIMVIWGRLCAILCTAAWLYLVPRFRHAAAQFGADGSTTNGKNNSDLISSEEYKKKVILNGFLHRDRK